MISQQTDPEEAAPSAWITVRPAMGADLEAVEKILSANRLPLDGVAAAFSNFLVAEESGAVVGAMGLELLGDAALLRSAVVDEKTRGTGVGSRLVQQLLELARELKIRDVYLLTTTAEGYFSRFGFTRIARDDAPEAVKQSAEFTTACPASAALMLLSLAPAGLD